jgi:DNA-binding HxlR family transcriptional regulator
MAKLAKRLQTKRLPLLPAERALKVISGRWKAVILYHLFDGPRRLSVLKTLVPDITQKVLIQQLREWRNTVLSDAKSLPKFPRASNIRRRDSAIASSLSFWRSASGASTMRVS